MLELSSSLMMNLIKLTAILFCLLSKWLNQASADEASDLVLNECNNGLKGIVSIEKFESFMKDYKLLVKQTPKPKRKMHHSNGKLIKCYELEKALLTLEGIIADRDKAVCQMQYIDRMVDFHEKYLVKQKPFDPGTSPKTVGSGSSFLAGFFSLYAHQVAFTCKSKLQLRIDEAQKKHDCSEVVVRYLPPPSDDKSESEELNEVAQFMSQFRRVEEFIPMSRTKLNNSEFYFSIMMSPSGQQRIRDSQKVCRAFEPYYTALLTPISTLAQLGYSISDDNSDLPDTDGSRIFRCWLATAQLCQGVLRTHLMDNGPSKEEKIISIKFGSMPDDIVIEQQDLSDTKFVDTISEIHPDVQEIVIKKQSKLTTLKRMKKKGQKILRKFIQRHVNFDALSQALIERSLSSSIVDPADTPVAYSGRDRSGGQYNPATVITDDIDSVIQVSTMFFITGKLTMLFSCIVAVALSAMFVYFTMYSIAVDLGRKAFSNSDNLNFKSHWRELRNNKMEKIKKNDMANIKLKVYKPE